jgi:formylglycine-generating enzyme required for sulfatase activity
MTMMYVPAGKFTLGNGASAFVISLNSFWIDQTEVTNAMYALCVQAGACKPPQSLRSLTRRSYYGNPEYNDYPVIYVDWFRSKAYCQWAGGRLLTDAEWEKAARGTDGRTFPWGEGISCSLSNYAIGCMGDTTVVRHYPSDKSPYGAYDMEGNVVEWVADWFSMSGGYYLQNPGDNPTGPISSDVRTVRGEGFDLDLNNRPANPTYARSETMPANATYSGGFRCAMDAQP